MSKCKTCKGFNAGIGDYCPKCIQEVRQAERDNPPILYDKAMVSHTNKVSHTKPKGVTSKTCSRCTRPRAVWSKSYCKPCHALRVKQWRTARHAV